MDVRAKIRDERGTIVPTAMIALLVMSSLALSFMALGANEPQIAGNLVAGDQALALAEAGVENAIWALNNTAASGITWPGTIPARYNSALPHGAASTFTAFGGGGYTVTITPAGTDATITATGWLPDNAGTPRAKRTVSVVVMSFAPPNLPPPPFLDLPAALNVKGEIDASGNLTVDSRTSTCGAKVGTYSSGTTTFTSKSVSIYGLDGNNKANHSGTDYLANQAPSTFDPLTLTPSELNVLKALAKANGTYYGPGYPPPASSSSTGSGGSTSSNTSNAGGSALSANSSTSADTSTSSASVATTASVTFDASHPIPNGIVFVDTVSGAPIGSPPAVADLANVSVTANTAPSGWLVVMGSITMSGTVSYNGLVYAADDFTGLGNITINGAVISLNATNSGTFAVGSTATGSAAIHYDCTALRKGATAGNPPKVPQGFLVKPGTWHEISG